MSDVPATPPPPDHVPPVRPARGVLGHQFGGYAAVSIAVGLATILVPLFFGRPLFFLPIVGVIGAIQALRRGRTVGAIVGMVLSVIGGIITLYALYG